MFLLFALSEHVGFTAACTLAGVGLISGYVVRVLRSAFIDFGVALTAPYAML